MDQNNTNDQQTTANPVVVTDPKIQEPIDPIGGHAKEQGPILQAPLQEVLKPTEQEPVLAPEVKNVVTVTPNTEHIEVKKEQQAIGVIPAKADVSVHAVLQGGSKTPMDEETARKTIKSHKVVDSVRWLAMRVIEEAQRTHARLTNKDTQ